MFNTSRNKVSSSSVKTMQVCPRIKWESVVHWNLTTSIYRGLKATEAHGLTASSINRVFVKVYEVQFFELIFNQSMNVCLDFLFSQPETYIRIILRAIKCDTSCTRAQFHKCKESITGNLVCLSSSRSYYVLYTVRFCDQATSWSLSCDELKNFATNILLKLVIKSRTGIRVIG